MIQTTPTLPRTRFRTREQLLFDLGRHTQLHRERQSRRTEELLNVFRGAGVVALAALWATGLLQIPNPGAFGPTLAVAALYAALTALVVRAHWLGVRRWLVPATATLDTVLVGILCAASGGFDSGLVTVYFVLVATGAYRFEPAQTAIFSAFAFLTCGLQWFATPSGALAQFPVAWAMLGLMAALAVMVARALATARRISEEVQQGALGLAHLGASLSACADVAGVCRAAVADLSMVLGVEDVALVIRDRSGLRVRVASGPRGLRTVGAILAEGDRPHPAAQAMRAHEAVHAPQATSEMLAVPIAGSAECSGAVIAWGRHRHPVDDTRVEMALSAGRIVGAALERAADYEQVLTQSERDPLTGLYNRAALDRRVVDVTSTASRYALAMIDLDGFKRCNDAHGHATGDLVLTVLADHLRTWLRQTDIIARVGGDEFVVVLPNLSVAEAEPILRRLGGAVSGPWGVIHFSCGVAEWPTDGTDIATVMAEADAAMYDVKRHGGGNVLSYAHLVHN